MSRQNNLNTDLVSCEKGKHVISEKEYHSDSEDTWQQEGREAAGASRYQAGGG